MNKSRESLTELLKRHKSCKDKKAAYRINAIILAEKGYHYREIASVLLFDEGTISNWHSLYQSKGIDGLIENNYKGKVSSLSKKQLSWLKETLSKNLYCKVVDICHLVKDKFGVEYSLSGMTKVLHQLGFVYKKTKLVPGNPDIGEQEKFVEKYKSIRKTGAKIYFMDGVHPQHNCISGNGWILKGEEKQVKSNTGRQRLNINGAYSPNDNEVILTTPETINSDNTVKLLKKIEKQNIYEDKVYVICDNARYYRSRQVRDYLAESKIELIFLPPYSPNLNLIERLWHDLKKNILYNKYYPEYSDFRDKILKYLKNKSKRRKKAWASLMSENFHIFSRDCYA